MTARRDVAGKDGKQAGVPLAAEPFVAHVSALLDDIQAALLEQARAFRDANIVDVASYEELKEAVAAGAGRAMHSFALHAWGRGAAERLSTPG